MRRFITVLTLLFFSSTHVFAVSYYVNDSAIDDTGNGLTAETAKKYISSGIALMVGGDVLIIADGTYTGATNRIRLIPSGNYGPDTTDRTDDDVWTIIRAENDFGVTLDAIAVGTSDTTEEAAIALYQKSYVKIQGILVTDVTSSNQFAINAVYAESSNHIKFKNIGVRNCAESISSYASAVVFANTNYSLIEDCFATGYMRDGIGINGREVEGNHHNIMRRAVVRWDFHTGTQPRRGIVTYGGDITESTNGPIVMQNCITIDGNDGEGSTFTGGFGVAHEVGELTRYGCISLKNAGGFGFHSAEDGNCYNIVNDTCVGWDNTSGIWWRHLRGTVGDVSGAYRNTIFGGDITGEDSSTQAYLFANNNILVGGTFETSAITMGTGADINISYNDVTAFETSGGKYIIIGSDADADKGADIIYQMGVDDTLWGQEGYNSLQDGTDGQATISLWPFPNEDEIKTFFEVINDPPSGEGIVPATNDTKRGFCADTANPRTPTGEITLSSYIVEYLGNTDLTVEIYGESSPESSTIGPGTSSTFSAGDSTVIN